MLYVTEKTDSELTTDAASPELVITACVQEMESKTNQVGFCL